MPGRSGSSGSPGFAGSDAPDGRVEFIIHYSGRGPVSYKWRYDLIVTSHRAASQKGDDIIEPGCWVDLFLSVQNVGGSPTPKHQVSHHHHNQNQNQNQKRKR